MAASNIISKRMLNLYIDKLFLFFLAVGFIFLVFMFVIAGIFLYEGLSHLFINKFSEDQVEKSLFDLIKGIEFIFIAAVPYLLMLSVYKYFRVLFPFDQIHESAIPVEPNYETVQKSREEILFVRSLIVSIFIAVIITHMVSHLLKSVVQGQLDIPLSAVSLTLLIALIFYYAQIEKALPPNVKMLKPKQE